MNFYPVCSHCGTISQLEAGDSNIGRECRCQSCGNMFTIQKPDSEKAVKDDFKFFCPQCGQRLEATEDMCGQTINCPACKQTIQVPFPPKPVMAEVKQPAPSEPLPQTPEPPQSEPPQTLNRVCEWCATSIPEEAIKCPHCTKWRKDIAEHRKKYFTLGAIGVVLCLSCPLFFTIVWENSAQMFSAGEWHKVVTHWNSSNIALMQTSKEFSLEKFLSSSTAWVIIGGLIAGVWNCVLAQRTKDSLDRRFGSRWRL